MTVLEKEKDIWMNIFCEDEGIEEFFMINAIGKCDRGVRNRIHGSLRMSGDMPRGCIG